MIEKLPALLGILLFLFLCYALSENRKLIQFRVVLWGLGLQLLLGVLILGVPSLGFSGPLYPLFQALNSAVVLLIDFNLEGSRFIFGDLVNTEKYGFIFAFQVLPTIIFVGSLMSILYHWGLMQKVVSALAWVMQKTMRISGAESLSTAANVFVGQTEAPLVIKPYLASMTRSEILCVMTGGMATVAGGVLAAYVGLLKDRIPEIAGHLLTASFMSAPATILISKLLIPENKQPLTMNTSAMTFEPTTYTNTIEAAAEGASDGLKLALNVAAMLLAFIALLALVNYGFSKFGEATGFTDWGPSLFSPELLAAYESKLSLQLILGYLLAPIAWLMGIPWSEAHLAAALIGEKVVLNEFVAYLHMSHLQEHLTERTIIILSYALCGFANFSSIAIQVGGIGGLAPQKKSELADLGLKAVLAGSLATFMTAAIAALLI